MGKSFVMKRPDGSLAGYLMQESDGTVCFRAHTLPDEGATLTLLFQSGRQARRPVSGERETSWSERREAIEAAFVSGDGRLFMSTGERGRRAFEAALERAQTQRLAVKRRAQEAAEPVGRATNRREEAHEHVPDGAPGQEGTEPCEEKKARQAAPAGYALPERRWPPQPCMPGARYEDGRWQT